MAASYGRVMRMETTATDDAWGVARGVCTGGNAPLGTY